MVSILCVLLIIFAALWLIGEFIPQSGPMSRVGRICWVVLATIMLCGIHLTAD